MKGIIRKNNWVIVPELAHLLNFKRGVTWNMLWKVFYYTRLFKYVRQDQYRRIQNTFFKLCTKDRLNELCNLGFLRSPSESVYIATNKVLPILKEAGFNIKTLPEEAKGSGDSNELNNTSVFIDAFRRDDFFTLLYPEFKQNYNKFLIPDALLVLKRKDENRYKLVFLEIESKKPDWINYLGNKRDKYLQLASNISFYDYWKSSSVKLGLACPPIEKLKFSVSFVCSLKKDFGKGFNFVSSL